MRYIYFCSVMLICILSVSCAGTLAPKTEVKHNTNALAQYKQASQLLYSGQNDYATVVSLLQQARQENFAPAKVELANLYLSGLGVQVDNKQAFNLLQQAANQQYAVAQYQLALHYLTGYADIVVANAAKSIDLLQLAAQQNYAPAQKKLADILIQHSQRKEDFMQALVWYNKSAQAKYPLAAAMLSYLYFSGNQFITKDLNASIKWATKAAELGYPDAQRFVAHAYLKGNGVTVDVIKAYLWLGFAANNGVSVAQTELNQLAENMSAEQISQAWDLSTQYAKKYNVVYNEQAVNQYFVDLAINDYLKRK